MMMTILLVIIEIKVYVKDLNQSRGLCMMASQLVGCLVAFFLLLSNKNFMVLSIITGTVVLTPPQSYKTIRPSLPTD